MVRPIQVRSRADLEKLASELENVYTIVFVDDDHFLAMKDGRVVKRFRTDPRWARDGPRMTGKPGELPLRGHVFLMYDELEVGTRLEARLLMDGLSKGERCVYATHQDVDETERRLAELGVPVEEFKRGKLKIVKVEDPFQGRDGWPSAVGRIIEQIMSHNPDRIVSWRWIRDLTDKRQLLANKQVERFVNAAIRGEAVDPSFAGMKSFSGLLACSYLLGGAASDTPLLSWLENHLASHDMTVLAGTDRDLLLMNRSN
ncbi:MAG: MEDS domain-containing protein [Nitrososphaerota archaeon]|nr:MEDS domain-containing protein [Nitrososphaerota archaeon]MDG7023921.1 MEDS domain-containing protein [Nitrososphaerota archaeon]